LVGANGCAIINGSTWLANPTAEQLDIFNHLAACMGKIAALERLRTVISIGADRVTIPEDATCETVIQIINDGIGDDLVSLPTGWEWLYCPTDAQLFLNNHAQYYTQEQLDYLYDAPILDVCDLLKKAIETGRIDPLPMPNPDPTPGPGAPGDNPKGDDQAFGQWVYENVSVPVPEAITLDPVQPGGGDVVNANGTAAFVAHPSDTNDTDIYIIRDREAVKVEGLLTGEKRSPILVHISDELEILAYILVGDDGVVTLNIYNLSEETPIYFPIPDSMTVDPDSRIAWTPSGILVTLLDSQGQPAIYRLNPGDPASYEQALIPNATNPAISSDDHIIFQRVTGGNNDIHIWFPLPEISDPLDGAIAQDCFSPTFGTDPVSFYFICRDANGQTTLYGQSLSDSSPQPVNVGTISGIQFLASGPADQQLTIDDQQVIYCIPEEGGEADVTVRLEGQRVSNMFWLITP